MPTDRPERGGAVLRLLYQVFQYLHQERCFGLRSLFFVATKSAYQLFPTVLRVGKGYWYGG